MGKKSEQTTETGQGHNSEADLAAFKAAGPFVDRVLNVQADIDAIMDKAKEECEPLREDIKVIKGEALDAGFQKKVFNTYISRRKDLLKIEKRRMNLDEEHRDNLDQMTFALEPEAA